MIMPGYQRMLITAGHRHRLTSGTPQAANAVIRVRVTVLGTHTRPSSGSERECLCELGPPWGIRGTPVALAKVKEVVQLGEEVSRDLRALVGQ
jgi:hypothetical protein